MRGRVGAPVILIVVAGVLATGVLAAVVRGRHEERVRHELERRGAAVSTALARAVEQELDLLNEMRALWAASQEVTADEFGEFAQRGLVRRAAVQAVAWAERADGAWPVRFVAPQPTRWLVPGRDLATDADVRATLRTASESRRFASAPPERLAGGGVSILVVAPLFADFAVFRGPGTGEAARGVVAGMFRLDVLAEAALTPPVLQHLAVELRDMGVPGAPRIIAIGDAPPDGEVVWSTTLDVADRRLSLAVRPTDPMLTATGQWQTTMVVMVGLLFTAVLALYLFTLLDRTATVERLVQVRTAELETANRDLESFSYSVSHDLRAPLRAIDGFSVALLEDHAHLLDVEAREFLGRIRGSTQRMGQMIDGLLGLARVARGTVRPERVDLSDLADEVVTELRARDPGREVDAAIQPGLVAVGDPALLRTLFENLLGNAWKYTEGQRPAHIVFGANERGEGPVFFVRDDGVGFDMAHARRLFEPFERLPGSERYPGSGIGLATVRRVVQRHGGRLWAHSAPGRGATFYFTLATLAPTGDGGNPS